MRKKKQWWWMAVLILWSSFCAADVQGEHKRSATVLIAHRTSDRITIDGISHEPVWEKASSLYINIDDGSIGKVTVTMKVLYDDDAIYIQARWADKKADVSKKQWIFDDAAARWIPSKTIDPRNKPVTFKEDKGLRLYLIDNDRIVHLISWHQVQDEGEFAAALMKIRDVRLIPEDKVRLSIIGDGAPWIWNKSLSVFPKAKQVLDFYHCSEYIHAAANAQFGKGTKQAREWVEATFTRLFHNDIDNVLHGMQIMRPVSSEAQEKIADAVRYLSERKHQVNYGSAKRAGYHIGSGAIESANKFIGHVRLKRSGAWWYRRYTGVRVAAL